MEKATSWAELKIVQLKLWHEPAQLGLITKYLSSLRRFNENSKHISLKILSLPGTRPDLLHPNHIFIHRTWRTELGNQTKFKTNWLCRPDDITQIGQLIEQLHQSIQIFSVRVRKSKWSLYPPLFFTFCAFNRVILGFTPLRNELLCQLFWAHR